MVRHTALLAICVSTAACWTGTATPPAPTAPAPSEGSAPTSEPVATAEPPEASEPVAVVPAPTQPPAQSPSAPAPAPRPAPPAPKPVRDVEPFASLIRDKYRDRQDVVKTELGWLASTSAAFDAAWAPYAARKREVDAAVAKADDLEAANNHAEARAVLEAVITPVQPNDRGELPTKRKFLEPRDAELPAVFALAHVALAQGDMFAFASLGSNLLVRRRVLDADSERKLWVAAAAPDKVAALAAGHTQDTFEKIRDLRACAHEANYDGATLLNRFTDTVYDEIEYGLVSFHKPRNKKGAWVLLKVKPTKLDDKTLTFKRTDRWVEEYDCKQTNRIISYDPIFKKFHYEMRCKRRDKSQLITLTADLAAPPPAWATDGARDLTVLGKIKSPGPSWSLTDARIVDDRYKGSLPSITPPPDGGRCAQLAPPKS